MTKILLALAVAAPLGAAWGATAPATAPAVSPALVQFSQATADLYNQISPALVRVRIDQSPSSLLPASLLKEYQEWRRNQTQGPYDDDNTARGPGGGRRGDGRGFGRGDGGGGPGAGPGGRRGFPGGAGNNGNSGGAGGGGDGDPSGFRAPAQGNPALVRSFLDQKVKEIADKDPDQAATLRGLAIRIDAVRAGITGDLYGVAFDNKGSIIVLTSLLREAQPESLHVTTQDGTDATAHFLGSYPSRGYSIIQLDKPSLVTPVAFADGRPVGGSLLLSVAANNGATGWIIAPAKVGKRPLDERIPMFAGDDRGGAFLFDTQGRLAALGFGRFAQPLEGLSQDIAWIVENKKDVMPRQLGVRYSLVAVGRGGGGGGRQGARVDSVQPGSPAEKSGLKSGDVVLTIDKRPVVQLPQIQLDLATRSGTVPMGIMRDGKEMVLDLPLDATPPTTAK